MVTLHYEIFLISKMETLLRKKSHSIGTAETNLHVFEVLFLAHFSSGLQLYMHICSSDVFP